MKPDISRLSTIAIEAGKAILSVYNGSSVDFGITFKEDSSPITIADRISNDIILKGLADLTPAVPVMSEEEKSIAYSNRKNWEYYWCVDPLDGTKEFIKRNGEFTVNIALIHRNRPILGIIYYPLAETLYIGDEQGGSRKITKGVLQPIKADTRTTEWIAAVSRSHAGEEEDAVLANYPVASTMSVGSSLKFCMIAEGKAHIYYRSGPTMEWDTAAGHAIAIYSGAKMTTPEGRPFLYNKESLLNGSFLCTI